METKEMLATPEQLKDIEVRLWNCVLYTIEKHEAYDVWAAGLTRGEAWQVLERLSGDADGVEWDAIWDEIVKGKGE